VDDDKVKAANAMYARLFVSAGVLLLAFLHVGWPTIFDNTALLLFLLALAPWIIPSIVPFLSRYFQSVEALGGKLVFIRQELEEQSSRLDKLYALSMGDKVFNHLEKLNASGGHAGSNAPGREIVSDCPHPNLSSYRLTGCVERRARRNSCKAISVPSTRRKTAQTNRALNFSSLPSFVTNLIE
jgi:hypothetical protein